MVPQFKLLVASSRPEPVFRRSEGSPVHRTEILLLKESETTVAPVRFVAVKGGSVKIRVNLWLKKLTSPKA